MKLNDIRDNEGAIKERMRVGRGMGSGKGNVEYYIAKVKPGKVLFEMEGVTEAIAREAFRLAASKLSVDTQFVTRQVR